MSRIVLNGRIAMVANGHSVSAAGHLNNIKPGLRADERYKT